MMNCHAHYQKPPMKNEFGKFLETEMDAQRLNAAELAAQVGVDASLLSGFLNGKRTSCRTVTLMKIVGGISGDHEVQAKCLEAYFRDQCIKRIKPWVKVAPPGGQDNVVSTIIGEEPPDHQPESATDELLETLTRLRTPRAAVLALRDIAIGMDARHKFRAVIEGLAKFAREDLVAGSEA